jgi:phenylalanyl-tRNA synthetase beta chain
VPTYRPDVEREIDLVEEVAIVYGYENIPTTVPGKLTQSGRLTPAQKLERRARAAMRSAGLNETISYSMISAKDLDRMGYPEDAPERNMLPLASPMIAEQSHMRSTLLPSMLQAAEHNQRQRVESVRLYEVANVFEPRGQDELPHEQLHAAGMIMGPYWSSRWNMPDEALMPDFFTLKGVVEQLVAALGVTGVSYVAAAHPACHPGQCAGVELRGQGIGVIGKIAPEVQKEYDLAHEVFVFELDLRALLDAACQYSTYRQVPRFPAALRDIAVVVDDTPESTCEALEAAIRESGGEQLSGVEVFDLYDDAERLGAGKKQLAFSLSFRTREGTLTDEQVDELVEGIVTHLKDTMGAELRS